MGLLDWFRRDQDRPAGKHTRLEAGPAGLGPTSLTEAGGASDPRGRHAAPPAPSQSTVTAHSAAPPPVSQATTLSRVDAPTTIATTTTPAPAPAPMVTRAQTVPAQAWPAQTAPTASPVAGTAPANRGASSAVLVAGTRGVESWIPPGVTVDVDGLLLPGGMLYVGRNLRALNGSGAEPALIDPRLRVDQRRADWDGTSVGYWPSYDTISAGARAAYLAWLADGRRAPNAPISWVFLFFYGLERRVLFDSTQPRTRDAARAELPAIRAEVVRLLDIYGGNHSFRGYGGNFINLVDFYLTEASGDAPPDRDGDPWHVPMTLRAQLGEFAVDGTPVPAEWALTWAYYHPEIYFRTPANRCRSEFEQLFRVRYTARHRNGIIVRATKTMLRFDYYAASGGIGGAELSTKLPDVLTQAGPTKKLAALVDDATSSLDAYSRYVGRNPDAAGTLAAAALLPPELAASSGGGELGRLLGYLDQALGQQPEAVLSTSDLLAFWPTKTPGTPGKAAKAAKADCVALATLLGGHGYGLEPDVRLGGPVLTPDAPTVVFRTASDQPTSPSPEYAAATVLLHLAAAVTAADGTVSDTETTLLAAHLEQSMHLSAAERIRLGAHLRWLLAAPLKLTGLTRRLASLEASQRDAVGDFLATVAAADGHVSPAEITTLQKIFRLLELDPASVYTRVHAATTAFTGPGSPATGPVTVRSAAPDSTGYAIPAPPAPPMTGRHAAPDPVAMPVGAAASAPAMVRLDAAAVAVKLAETAAVSALLGAIFTDDDPVPAAVPNASVAPPGGDGGAGGDAGGDTRGGVSAAAPLVAGLDAPHSALLRLLAGSTRWSRAEFEAECDALGLLPDGAIDTLNEAAYDAVGDPLIDDAGNPDELTIDPQVAQEMQA